MPQLEFGDWAPQLVWLAITFTFLYVMMSRVALPRIGGVLEARADHIASDIDGAGKLVRQTDEAIAAYEQEIAEARGNAHAFAAETRSTLNAELAAEREKVEKALAEQTSKAEEGVRGAKDDALKRVNDIAAETAEAIVESLIGVKPTKDELTKALKA